MRAVERLVELGIDPECAVDTAIWYNQQGNEEGLEEYIHRMEEKLKKDRNR